MKIKSAVFGFIAGALSMATIGTVIGADTVVVGTLKPDISFKVDGNISQAPRSMSPVNYNGYTYVPVRYIGEMLGCNVEWNAYQDMVIVDYPEDKIKEVVREVEKIVYVEKGESVDGTVYSQLPISKRETDYEATVLALTKDEYINQTRVYVEINNKQNENIQVDQDACVLVVDGKEYSISRRQESLDNGWYNNIKKDTSYESYLAFDFIPEDAKQFTLKLVVRKGLEKNITNINFIK